MISKSPAARASLLAKAQVSHSIEYSSGTGFSVVQTQQAKRLGRPVDSIERLTLAARSYTKAVVRGGPLQRLGRPRLEDLFRHNDPHFRYAGVILGRSVKARHYRYDEALANLFMVEPTAFVRRTAARALGTADKGLVELVVRDGLQEDVPETVYLIEAADYDAISWLAHEEKSESAPGLLARCRQIESDTAYIREAELLSILSKAVVPDSDPELRASLEDWYLNERERAAGPGLRRIPDRILRRAVSLLSPLEKGGLGTFDELALIPSTENSRSARRKTLSQTPIGQHPASVGQPGS